MRHSISLALVALAATAGTFACFSDRASGTGTTVTGNCTTPGTAAGATVVFITAFTFKPATVHVRPGGSVAWVNCEPTAIPHTSTSDGAGWDSGTLAQNAAFVRSFASAGTFAYHCAIHPSMKATVIVDP